MSSSSSYSCCSATCVIRICIPQDSTDSNLDVPVLEALQRRHSDVKLNTNAVNASQIGLAPPRSPELRRHSDVSPASLRELEKLKGGTKTTSESDWDIKGTIPSCIEIEPPTRIGSRRQSRVSRQHSYDDDIQKNAIANMNAEIDTNLGLAPGQIPRRFVKSNLHSLPCFHSFIRPFIRPTLENRPMTSSVEFKSFPPTYNQTHRS